MTASFDKLAQALQRLDDTIAARRNADPSSSYTAQLLAGGVERAAKKFGEEAVEAVIAAVQGDPDALAAESADLLYHWRRPSLSSLSIAEGEYARRAGGPAGSAGRKPLRCRFRAPARSLRHLPHLRWGG